MIAKPERHVVYVSDLTESEAAAMGSVLHRATVLVAELCDPDPVYVNLWSHPDGVPSHIRFVVQPVNAELTERFDTRGPKLQSKMFDSA